MLPRRFVCVASVLVLSAVSAGEAPPDDFAFDVLPHLYRSGCAAASCHGSATGRGGFKLSLFGTDPDADYHAITTDLSGRRIDRVHAGRSLVLRKPSRDLPHEGGRVLAADLPAYSAIERWIAAGAKRRSGVRTELVRLSLTLGRDGVDSSAIVLGAGDQRTPRVEAEFIAGGSRFARDVTSLAVFRSSSPGVVSVDASGRITAKNPGKASIFARFAQRDAELDFVVPFPPSDTDRRSAPPSSHALDVAWRSALEEVGLSPDPEAAPMVVARRLYLDLVGRPPSPSELRAYSELPANARVAATAEQLLATPEFARQFAFRLAEWWEVPLETRSDRSRDAARRIDARRIHRQLAEAIARDAPLAELARRVIDELTGESVLRAETVRVAGLGRPPRPGGARRGSNQRAMERSSVMAGAMAGTGDAARSFESAVARRFRDARDRAEYVGRTFLGLNLGCARCHNHPLDRWTQNEYLGFAAAFAGIRRRGGSWSRAVFYHPDSGDPIVPRRLDLEGEPRPTTTEPRPEPHVSDFVLDERHGHFERATANRIFAAFIGRGLVEPVDDHRGTNPPIHRSMLTAITRAFSDAGGRARPFLRWLVTSAMYRVSSDPPFAAHPGAESGAEIDTRRSVDANRLASLLVRREARSLDDREFRASVEQALGIEIGLSDLPDEPLARQLALLNSGVLTEPLAAGKTLVEDLVFFAETSEELLEALYLLILSRPPRRAEIDRLAPALESEADRTSVARDLAAALVLSREFGVLR